ncbi:hypothetical protein BH09BAC1_BH09BAC1_00450 [soil metagenome]
MNHNTLKALLGFALSFLFFVTLMAQAPQGFNYQAVVRNAQGTPITTGTVALKLSIRQANATGTVVFTEVHHPQPNAFGLVNVVIGSAGGNLATVNWGNGDKFLQVEMDIANGTNFTSISTTQLMSVPYALHAGNVLPQPPGNNAGDILVWDGTTWVPTPKCSLFTYYFRDADGDGRGDKFHPVAGCGALPGFVADSTDCDDTNANSSPNTVWYADADGDGFGSKLDSTRSCLQPSGFVANNNDCDDTDNLVLNGNIYYRDFDGDGNGSPFDSIRACTMPVGYVPLNTDCDDNDNTSGAPNTYFRDQDLDGFGDNFFTVMACSAPAGYVALGGDCDDNNQFVNPNTAEVCDHTDNNCNGLIDENTDFVNDVNNCGDCGLVCSLPNATSSCGFAQCMVASCMPGFADINGNPADGCEVNLATNCVITGQAFANGTLRPGSPCQVCNVSLSNSQWSNVAAGAGCGSGTCDGTGICVP